MQPGTDKLRADGHGPNGQADPGEAVMETPNWREYAGKHVTVHAPEGSYAAKRAPAELREADRAFDALEKLLDPPDSKRGDASRVDVYLADRLPPGIGDRGQGTGSANGPISDPRSPIPMTEGSQAVVRVVQPEAPGEPVTWPLTRLLAGRWYGQAVASAALFLNGIAGVVAARIGSGPSIKEADEAVREALEAGRPVSVFESPPSSPKTKV